MSLTTTHMSSEAMLCKIFCVKFGNFVDGESYIDANKVIHAFPDIWEVIIKHNHYSCFILSTPSVFYFRKDYRDYWGMGIPPPEEFQYFSFTAKDYVGYNYPKSLIFVAV